MRWAPWVVAATLVLGAGCSTQTLGNGGSAGDGAGGSPGAGGFGAGGAIGAGGTTVGDGGSSGFDAGLHLNGPCQQSTDCESNSLFCAAPGQPTCGICGPAMLPCVTDLDCAALDGGPPSVCDPFPCVCTNACHPGCQTDGDCAVGLSCGANHHCAPTACTPVSDACPVDFACDSGGHCARKSCTSASECSNSCVNLVCYGTPGTCVGLEI